MMRLEHEILELRTRHAFHIARARGDAVRRTVLVRVLDDDGTEGWGEAPVSTPYYGETADTVVAVLPRLEAALHSAGPLNSAAPSNSAAVEAGAGRAEAGSAPRSLPPLEHLERALAAAVRYNAGARVAVSAALYDLVGKRLGVPVWALLGLDPADAPASSFTIGLDDAGAMKAKLEEAAGYPILKVKLGTPRDAEILELVRREAPDVTLRVDANTGWNAKTTMARLPLLVEHRVELIEQPVPPDDVEGLRLVRAHSPIPIVADESCRTAADIPRLVGAIDAVNIKLAKCGSLREAVRMVHVARAHGMGVMLGCMVESTLGIAAAVQLAPLADWVDLDGAALLAVDPFRGPGLEPDGRLRFNREPGLGVRRAAQ
jgi:L-Ala-D/L-Glu epimerase / N-acetyl-D-glutamate racemase